MKTFEDLTFGLNINLGELHYSFFVISMGALGMVIPPTHWSPLWWFYLWYIDHFSDGVACDIAMYADHTTLYSKCDRIADLWP